MSEQGLPIPTAAEPPSMLALIARAAADPSIDVEKMRALLSMHRELVADQARRQYNEAMNAAQAEIEPVARTAENTQTHSFYAKLENVEKAIKPIYLLHGFSVSYNTVPPLAPGNIRMEAQCSHAMGHVERFYREAGPDILGPKGAPTKTPLHGAGSTETFLKRYLVCGIFNVVFKNMDDDGNGGPISDEQAAELLDLIKKAGAGPRFLRYMHALSVEEAGSLEAAVASIAYRDYPKAVSTLDGMIRKKAETQ